VPKADTAPSLDHLVCTSKQCWRNSQAERLRSLEVDDEFEPHRLLDWQIPWLLSLENASSIDADLAIRPACRRGSYLAHDYEQRDRYHQSQRRLSAGYDVGRKHHEITGDVSRKQTIQSEKANDIDASSNKGQNQWKQHNARRAADRRNRHTDTPPNRSGGSLGIHSEANLTNRRPIR